MDGCSCGHSRQDEEQTRWYKWFNTLTPEQQAEWYAKTKVGPEAEKELEDNLVKSINRAILADLKKFLKGNKNGLIKS